VSAASTRIVSDMRMPGMDGWQLLGEVKKLHPQTVRLVLSGHADPSSVMLAVGTAQLYLAKPCESGALKAAIVQTQMLRRLLSSDRLALMVGKVGMSPSAPTAFQEILGCLQDPAASLTDALFVKDEPNVLSRPSRPYVSEPRFPHA
jgi:DNA-binding NtrC family response regulator